VGPVRDDGEAAIEVTPVRWSGKADWEAAKPLGFSGVTPAGAVVVAAVEAYGGGSGEPPPSVREPAEARRADALVAVAEAALAAGHCLWDSSKLDLPLAVESLLILDGRFEN